MAQVDIAQAYAGASASKMERDLVLWARDGGDLKTRFEETERKEHEAYLAAQEVIRAKFEHKRRSLSAKLSLEETQELSDITESAAKAELSNLQQDYEAARDRRARAHAEDIKFHHEKVHALMALSQPAYAPAVNPFASPVQHNNAAYQSNAANSAYSSYSTAPSTATQVPSGTVGADGSRYENNAQYPARQSPQMASSATPQSYNATAYPYQQQSGTYHRGPAEENRSAPSAYQQPLNPAVDNQHHHSPAKAQQPFHTHVEQRRVSDQPAPLAPAQPKIPSHYVLPSQRDPSELVGRHGAQEQRYGPTSNLMPAPQPVAEAEERGAVERQAIAPSRRSSGVSDGLAGTQDTMASRTKRKADEAVPSPEGSVLKRTRGMDATFDADRLRRPRTAGRDAAGGQGVSQSPQSQSARKPSAGESRTTTFDEVYQDGNPRYKHLIVEFPASSNRFYILRCDDHGVHFNASNPLAGAAKHLASTQHGNMTKEHANAIERLGWRIVDCTPEKANVNNEMVKLAFQAGYKAFNRNFLTKKDRKSLEGNGATEGLPAPHREMPSGRRVSSRKQEASARKQPVPVPIAKRTPELVTDPAPGELYRAFWSEEKRNYAVVVLPWGDLSRVGFNGTLATTGLLDRAPKCYVIDRMVPKILGWSAGFEDGGSLVDKREFPVCYFDNRSSVGWVRARDLQPFDYDDPSSVPNFDEAVRYLSKVREFSQAEPKPGQPDAGVPVNSGGSLPEKKDSTSAATTAAATPQPQEDEVMADAPPVSDDDSESFHASEFSAVTDDVEMEGAESRRTSISNKAAPQSNGLELVENPSVPSQSPPTSAPAQAPILAGNENTGKSGHEVTKQPEATATSSSAQLRSEESKAVNKPDTKPDTKSDTDMENKTPAARPATASAPPPDRALDAASETAGRPKSATGLSTAPVSQALPQPLAQPATDQAPRSSTSELAATADPSSLATKPAEEQPQATDTEGKPTTIFAAGLGPLVAGGNVAAAESAADRWRAIRAPSIDGAARPKTAESRPASAGSLRGVRSAPNRSPITTPSSLNATRANSPSQLRSQYPPNTELFEVSRFQDDRAAGSASGAIVLALDKTAKKLEGKLENGVAVTIDITKIVKIVRNLNDPDFDPKGRTTIATIYSNDEQGEHKQTLILKSRDTMGKGLEYGCIHARRLVRLLLGINPSIESVNQS